MSRTNVDIDDEACDAVMRLYHLRTKRDAINFALRKAAIEPMPVDEVLSMRGIWADRPLDECLPPDRRPPRRADARR